MSPFKSKAQEKAAFSGALGPEMKSKAKEWASVTDQKHIPEHVKKQGSDRSKTVRIK